MKFRLFLSLLYCFGSLAIADSGYFRFPALHENTLVFTAEGDLWISDIKDVDSTSNARRLTTHPAEEKQAAISKDGLSIVFAANYQGTTEVYVIPTTGGIAKRISFENTNVRVQGWTHSGEVLYSTNSRIGPTNNWTLKAVNPETLVTRSIPLADAVEGVMDDKEKTIFFTQFGLQVSNDNSKVYRGGAKGELWRFQLNSTQEAIHLTAKHEGSTRQPMVYREKLYFISDASGADNLWSMNHDGSDLKPVTQYKDWAIRSARIYEDKLVYQLGADIKLLELSNNRVRDITIKLTSDFPHIRERWINKPLKYMTSARLAGDFEKLVITARGKVSVAGIDKSRLIEIKTNPESRTRNAILSHDGKSVYAINDASGELELWQFAADGSNEAKQLTNDGNVFRWNIYQSPDGQWLAHDDKDGNLWLLNLKTGRNKKILTDDNGLSPIVSITWSSDSRLLALTRSHVSDTRNRVELYAIDNAKRVTLTSDKYHSYSPTFSPDGNWLYFLSERNFNATPNSPWGDRNMGPAFDRRVQIFAYALKQDSTFAFQPPNELSQTRTSTENDSSKEKAIVDWENLNERLWQVPVDAGNYYNLSATEKFLFVQDRLNEPDAKPSVKAIEIKPFTEIKTFSEEVEDFQLSDSGKKIFVRKSGSDNTKLYIVDVGETFPKDSKDSKVLVKDWQMLLDPKKEWRQLFHDGWLMHRDSLFDKSMRGLDWKEVSRKYQPLLQRLTDRYELNDIFSQMMGELNSLHSQVRGGDYPKDTDSPKAATLGATFTQTANGVLVEHIYQHDEELPDTASPLRRPGVDVKPGDQIIAVNGLKVSDIASLHSLLRNQAGKQVLLELKRTKKTHKTVVVPATTNEDYRLRYNDWVDGNRKKVENKARNIGYLHLHAMGGNDVASFAREFYANYQKKGLILDVRRNRGGNIDSWILEKLLRRAWMFWQPTRGPAFTNMQQAFRGHLVVLADQFTYSDGETFTAGIKALDLAPVIGKRTAGAGVWLRGGNRLADNGMARVAEFPQFSLDGEWLIEGHGVEPTIEVDNLPHATFKGQDAQLQSAINYLVQKIEQEPVLPLKAKPLPGVNTPAGDIR